MIDRPFLTGIGFLGMSIVFALYLYTTYNGANISTWEGEKAEVGSTCRIKHGFSQMRRIGADHPLTSAASVSIHCFI